MQVPQYYNNVPENFLGQRTTKKKRKRKRKRRRKGISTGIRKDNLNQYFTNRSQAQAWAITTNTIPGLLTREKNLMFSNRILTKTLPRHRGEVSNTRKFVNELAWSQQRINAMNRRLLIDEDDPVRRNLLGAFNAVGIVQHGPRPRYAPPPPPSDTVSLSSGAFEI